MGFRIIGPKTETVSKISDKAYSHDTWVLSKYEDRDQVKKTEKGRKDENKCGKSGKSIGGEEQAWEERKKRCKRGVSKKREK